MSIEIKYNDDKHTISLPCLLICPLSYYDKQPLHLDYKSVYISSQKSVISRCWGEKNNLINHETEKHY